MAQNDPHDNSIYATHWAEDTPILVEALAAAVHTTVFDVCEHLEDNLLKAQDQNPNIPPEGAESIAVKVFVADFIAA